ncbi:MAG TPA: ABC transporter permease [candidate division Zixibacteria bacterium]|nr:ABC transporter permease [candidate division Zixibacteria bacterium]
MKRVATFYAENEHHILGGGFILLLLLFWESTPLVFPLPKGVSLFFTTPSRVAEACYQLIVENKIQEHFYTSAVEFLAGLGLAVAVGLPLGLVTGRSRVLDAMIDPFITVFNATPRLIFLPLFILWFGIGIWSKIMIVFVGALFPLLINTYEGVKNVDRVLVNVVKSFGASEWQTMRIVVLPNSVPYLVAGLRLAIGRAILGVVVGEFFGASKGLGFMIATAATNYKVDVVFVGMAIFMGLSLILTMAVKKVESRLARWRPEETKTF